VRGTEAKFLDTEHVGGRLEGGKRRHVGDDVDSVGEAGVQAAQKIQHKLRRGDGVADLPEGVDGALHLLGVGVDGEVTLGQAVVTPDFRRETDASHMCARI
jgi:hypothetical protein